ncbi:MAG: AI-2E family transporter [Elusimicrobiota bacterium]|jgi:AI-2 transport protein TqsA|nr:AI-2E family transporter [Elusimicrobiota bacterium]
MLTKQKLDQYIPINNICLIILAGVALTWFLAYTKSVLMPFVIALFISIVCKTIAGWLHRKYNLPQLAGLIIAVLLFLALAALAVWFIINSVETFIDGADSYAQKVNDTLAWFLAKTKQYTAATAPAAIAGYLDKLPVFNMLQGMGSLAVSLFTNIMLITLFVIFMFIGSATEQSKLGTTIENRISHYLLIKIFVSFLAAFLTWITLASLKCELALMLALITFLLNFIPNIGPLISTFMPMPVLFLQYGFDWHIILALSLLTAIHFTIGNVFETRLLGKRMDLHPIVVIFSLIFWALVWGVVGALLAVPLTSILKMALEQSEPTKPLAGILAGKMPFE